MAAALKSYQASLAIRERLAKSDPGNAGWQRDLSVSYEQHRLRAGGAGRHGRRAEILSSQPCHHRAPRQIRPRQCRLAARSVSGLQKIGDVQKAQGDLAAALKSYQASLAIIERLAKAIPWQCRLAGRSVASLYKVSTVSAPAEARAALTRALSIVDPLAHAGQL